MSLASSLFVSSLFVSMFVSSLCVACYFIVYEFIVCGLLFVCCWRDVGFYWGAYGWCEFFFVVGVTA